MSRSVVAVGCAVAHPTAAPTTRVAMLWLVGPRGAAGRRGAAAAPGRDEPTCGSPSCGSREDPQSGVLSLEAVWLLPALALLIVGLLLTLGLVRDVLLLHEAARAGARTAVTTTGTDAVVAAARQAAPELDLTVHVNPVVRRDGDLVTVQVHAIRTIGPVDHRLSARAVGRVEPVVGPGRPGPAFGPGLGHGVRPGSGPGFGHGVGAGPGPGFGDGVGHGPGPVAP